LTPKSRSEIASNLAVSESDIKYANSGACWSVQARQTTSPVSSQTTSTPIFGLVGEPHKGHRSVIRVFNFIANFGSDKIFVVFFCIHNPFVF
jgi:hypothetical protein